MQTFFRNYRDILKSVGEAVEKFLLNFEKTSIFLEEALQTLTSNYYQLRRNFEKT